MNSIKQQNLLDELVVLIARYNPEYVSQSEESETYIWGLINSIGRFEDECEQSAKEELEKQNDLAEMQGKH